MKTKLFCLIKTLDNNFVLINAKELKKDKNNNDFPLKNADNKD